VPKNGYLPTVHGFDEFYGNLYHLNAEEEPENPDYPKDPAFRATFGPRGVLDCKATDVDDPTVDPRFGPVGKQTIVDTGPLTKNRMDTAAEEFLGRTMKFIRRAHAHRQPEVSKRDASSSRNSLRCIGNRRGCARRGLAPHNFPQARELTSTAVSKLERSDCIGERLSKKS
jgi:arylsulfatase A-like enzyme